MSFNEDIIAFKIRHITSKYLIQSCLIQMSCDHTEICCMHHQFSLLLIGVPFWSDPCSQKVNNICKVIIRYAHHEVLHVMQEFLKISWFFSCFNVRQMVWTCIQSPWLHNYLKIIFLKQQQPSAYGLCTS